MIADKTTLILAPFALHELEKLVRLIVGVQQVDQMNLPAFRAPAEAWLDALRVN